MQPAQDMTARRQQMHGTRRPSSCGPQMVRHAAHVQHKVDIALRVATAVNVHCGQRPFARCGAIGTPALPGAAAGRWRGCPHLLETSCAGVPAPRALGRWARFHHHAVPPPASWMACGGSLRRRCALAPLPCMACGGSVTRWCARLPQCTTRRCAPAPLPPASWVACGRHATLPSLGLGFRF
jgi:hypothetical protein